MRIKMLLPILAAATSLLFTPPDGFEIADPKTPTQRAICGFIHKDKSGFCPSIHLTHEKISCSFEQYLQIIEKQAREKKRKWRKMGVLKTQSGPATIIEIELENHFGKIALMQALLPKGQDVHILTAGALKKQLSQYARSFEQTFQSMQVVEDLFALAKEPNRLKAYWQKRGEDLESFQRALNEETTLGPVWQIQLLRAK